MNPVNCPKAILIFYAGLLEKQTTDLDCLRNYYSILKKEIEIFKLKFLLISVFAVFVSERFFQFGNKTTDSFIMQLHGSTFYMEMCVNSMKTAKFKLF